MFFHATWNKKGHRLITIHCELGYLTSDVLCNTRPNFFSNSLLFEYAMHFVKNNQNKSATLNG